MKKHPLREHYERIGRATEEYLEEELASLTVEEACEISAMLLRTSRHLDYLGETARPFTPLSRLIARHRKNGRHRTRASAARRHRGAGIARD